MSEKEKAEKAYTQKSVQAELTRLEKGIQKKTDTLQQLRKEIKADQKRYKELLSILGELSQENLQKQIADAWFKEQKLTGEQIQKILELSKQLQGKIDHLDVSAVVQAVTSACEQEAETLPAAPDTEKVDTCSNFSESNSGFTSAE